MTSAVLTDHSVIALGQCHDKVVTACFLGSSDHFLLGRVRFAKADIISHGVVEQIYILKHHGNVGQQAVAGKFLYIMSANADTAPVCVIEPGNQAADGGFPAYPYQNRRE